MERDQFIEILSDEGFGEIVTVERAPNDVLAIHVHAFEAKALILDGEIELRVGNTVQVFKAGQIFHLAANEAHSERYGPDGVRYLVGRK